MPHPVGQNQKRNHRTRRFCFGVLRVIMGPNLITKRDREFFDFTLQKDTAGPTKVYFTISHMSHKLRDALFNVIGSLALFFGLWIL